MKINNTVFVTTLSLALTASVKLAADDHKNLEEMVVEGHYLSLDKVNSVKTPTPILNVPQSLSIISADQIQQQSFVNIGDVLRYTPGLAVSQGEGHRDAAIIRGIQTTADFFIDGVRDDVQYYRPLYNVAQVEILRGSNALLFGRGGGGGVINRVIKQAKVGEGFSSINAGVDSFGAYSIAADTNFSATDNTAFRVNALHQEHQNHRDVFDGTTTAINPTVKWQIGEQTAAMVSYEYLEDERVVDRGVPSVNTGTGVNVPLSGYRDVFFGSATENYTTNEAHIVRAKVDHRFSSNLRGDISAQYADFDKYYQNLYPSSAVNPVDGMIDSVQFDGYSDATQRQNLIIQANVVGEFNTAGIGHTVLFGAEYGVQDTANQRLNNLFEANGSNRLVVPYSQPLAIPNFSFSTPIRDRESDVTFSSIYIQDQIDVTKTLKLVAGFRYDEFDIDVFDITEANDGDNIDGNFARKDSEITPRYGLIYKPAENLSFYASVSETFLPRSGEQFLTLDLNSQSTRPQSFENREIGFKWDLKSGLSFTTSVFELDRESYTSVDPQDPSELILIEGSETSGVEFQLQGNVNDSWKITTGYSYLDGRVARVDGSGNNDNKTRQTPEHMFSIWNNLSISEQFSVGLGATYQDSFFIAEDNAVEVPSYTRVDTAVFYQINADTLIQLNIENLFDTEYFPDAHSNNNITTGRPLNGRLSVTMQF